MTPEVWSSQIHSIHIEIHQRFQEVTLSRLGHFTIWPKMECLISYLYKVDKETTDFPGKMALQPSSSQYHTLTCSNGIREACWVKSMTWGKFQRILPLATGRFHPVLRELLANQTGIR